MVSSIRSNSQVVRNTVSICGWVVAFAWVFAADVAFAHGGDLDNLGFHKNRGEGVYHCHRGDVYQAAAIRPASGAWAILCDIA